MWYLSFQAADKNQIESVITDWNTTGKAKELKRKRGEELFVKTFSTLLVKAEVGPLLETLSKVVFGSIFASHQHCCWYWHLSVGIWCFSFGYQVTPINMEEERSNCLLV